MQKIEKKVLKLNSDGRFITFKTNKNLVVVCMCFTISKTINTNNNNTTLNTKQVIF